MKISLIAYLSFSLLAHAQFAHPNDFRLIGTNLYDFSYAGDPQHLSSYLLSGTVEKIYPQSVEISVFVRTGYEADASTARSSFLGGGPGDQLQALAAFRMTADNNGQPAPPLSEGAYFALSPEMRQYFRPVNVYQYIYILNLTDELKSHDIKVGTKIQTLAVPTSTANFWDHGNPITNNPANYPAFFRVLPNRIVRVLQTNQVDLTKTNL